MSRPSASLESLKLGELKNLLDLRRHYAELLRLTEHRDRHLSEAERLQSEIDGILAGRASSATGTTRRRRGGGRRK